MKKTKKSKNTKNIKNISLLKYGKFHYCFKKINSTNYYLNEPFTFLNYGLKVLDQNFLYLWQYVTLKNTLKKFIKKKKNLKIKIICKFLLRKKKTGVRMGKGKGSEIFWVCLLNPGTIICELPDYDQALSLLKKLKKKLPLNLKIIKFLI